MKSRSNQWISLVIIYMIAYLYCLPFAIAISSKQKWKPLNDIHQSCIIGCNSVTRPVTKFRGDNYHIGESGAGDCLVTFWGLAHFGLYSCIGYACPDLFWESLGLGVAFEFYEKHRYKCHDALDVVFNTGGFLFGRNFKILLK